MQTSVLQRTSAFDAAPVLASTRSGGGTDVGCEWFGAMHDPQLCTISVKGISRLDLRPHKPFEEEQHCCRRGKEKVKVAKLIRAGRWLSEEA